MASLVSWLSPGVTHALGWALIHSLWQCLALAALAAVAMALSRRPSVRYLVAIAALAAMLAAPVATFLVLMTPTAPVAVLSSASPAQFMSAAPLVAPLTHAVTTAPGPVGSRTARLSAPLLSPDILAHNLLPWLVEAWACGVALFSLRFLGGLLLLEAQHPKARAAQFRIPEPRILALCHKLQRQLGLTRAIRYLECAWLEAPAVIGWLRPIVLLPVTALIGLNEAQLSAVIAHELAHIRRSDALVNLLQVAVETLLFYHPAVWWLNRRIRAERELACDEIAISLTGDRLEYARALTLMAEWEIAPALAMAANRGPLTERIFHILGRRKLGVGRRMLGVTVGLLFIAAAFGGADALFGFTHPVSHAKAILKPVLEESRAALDVLPSHVAVDSFEPVIRRTVTLVKGSRAGTLATPPFARLLRNQTVAVPQLVAVYDPPPAPVQPTLPKAPICAAPSVADQAELTTLPGSELRTVAVAINGQPKQFLLDIGAGPTEVSQQTVADLGLPDAGRRSDAVYANGYQPGDLGAFTSVSYMHSVAISDVKGSDGDTRAHVRAAAFTIGGATGHNLALAVAKDPEMGKSKPYDGLMTGAFFRQYDVELDFSRNRITYLTPTTCNDADQVAYWPHKTVAAIPTSERNGKIQVEVEVQGHQIPAVIDTASAHTVMRRDIAELMLGLKADTPDMTADGTVTDGAGMQVYRHTFERISFAGGVTAYNVPALIQSGSMIRNPNRTPILGSRAQFAADPGQRIPALTLGMDVLSQLHLYAVHGQQTLVVTAAD